MSNNPFLAGGGSSDAYDASNRFPAIDSTSQSSSSSYGQQQQPQWQPSPSSPIQQQYGYPNQQQQSWQQPTQYDQQYYNQQPTQYQQQQQSYYPASSSSFGQQPQGVYQQPTGYYGSSPAPPPQQQQQASYGNPMQYQNSYGQPNPSPAPSQEILYLFDPHTVASAASPANLNTITGGGGNDPRHPKGFLIQNKSKLETWDKSAWTAFLGTFETLKNAWVTQSTHYMNSDQQRNEAVTYAGDVAASQIQMSEGFQGYNVSRDPASKSRVRTAMNAAIASLPGFPPGF